jgi:Transposase
VDGEMMVTVGVDTHTDVHVAAVPDPAGRLLETRAFPATTRGYAQLASWAESFGLVDKVGMEGTGSFGAGLLRFPADYGLTVIEVDRPDRAGRRRNGKSDPLDAESAARAVQSGRATGTPKSRDAQVEMIRVLRVARRAAMKVRIQAGAQLDALIVTAPSRFALRCASSPLSSGSARARLCAPDPSAIRPPRSRPHCERWPAAGRRCRLRSTTSTPRADPARHCRRSRAPSPAWRRGRDRRATAGDRRGQPGPAPLRGVFCAAVRCCPDSRLFGKD